MPVRKTVRTHDVTCVATKVGTCWRSAQFNGSTCSPFAQQAVKQPPDSKRRVAGCTTEDNKPCRTSSHATSRGGSYGAALDVQSGQVSQKLRVLRVQLSPPAQMRAIRLWFSAKKPYWRELTDRMPLRCHIWDLCCYHRRCKRSPQATLRTSIVNPYDPPPLSTAP